MHLGSLLFMAVALIIGVHHVSASYNIGVGIGDITGPSADIIFMGYVRQTQKGEGIHLRQFARAFIIDDGSKRLVFVSCDIGMMGQGIRHEVLERLKDPKYKNLYTEQNVILSGTHTHGAPGGYLMNVLFDISILGFVPDSFNAAVNGIVESIDVAHNKMVEGEIYFNVGKIDEANINRSPSSYELNPEEERQKYDSNTDKVISQLRFEDKDGKPIGVINWFAVHPTSMEHTNKLITSDNMGYAAQLFEKDHNNGALTGKGEFVAAFASSNLGDVSPRTQGATCTNTGETCDGSASDCGGDAKLCFAKGPGKDSFESTSIIANKIYSEAKRIFAEPGTKIEGPVRFMHQFVDMPKQQIEINDGNGGKKQVGGCLPAMGFSFASGTTDCPGELNFSQGTLLEDEFWVYVRDFLQPPEEEDITCHAPKPILFATGRMKLPYDWQPEIVSSQIGVIGNVVIAAVPGEFTTMSGRRMREGLKTEAEANNLTDAKIIVAGLSNTYTDYITTFEEYQAQRYEAASTIFGPHTLSIHIEQYKKLLTAILKDVELDGGPVPEDLSQKQISLVLPVILDVPEKDRTFGECTSEPKASYERGETVSVEFISGHPRNNLMNGGSYLYVERKNGDDWDQVENDATWNTRFYWKRKYLLSSRVRIEWDIPEDYTIGTYRITHNGHSKSPLTDITPYKGSSKSFNVNSGIIISFQNYLLYLSTFFCVFQILRNKVT